MKFNELSEQDKIQSVKDSFVLILSQLASDPNELKKYIKVEEPKLQVAALERIDDNMTEDQKKSISERNTTIQAKVNEENERLQQDFDSKKATVKKVEEFVSKLEKMEGCLCGSCLNINITNSMVPQELEIFLEAARKEAENRVY